MRALPLCVLGLAATLFAAAAASLAAHPADPTFEAFKVRYGRTYPSADEEATRRAIYDENLAAIADLRQRNPFATFAVTQHADSTLAERKALRGGKVDRVGGQQRTPVAAAQDVLPESYPPVVDWRKRGAVTPVGSMGQCGTVICGFAFAANVEGVWAAKGYPLTPLSVMPAMMCEYPGQNGCQVRATYDYYMLNQSGRVQTAASWPYNETQCQNGDTNGCIDDRVYGARITSVVELPHNETAMTYSVAANGPIGVELDADTWEFYPGGVFTSCTFTYADHVSAIVGYDDTATPPYWIIKNSWGWQWGDNGFIKIGKGTNQCGVTTRPMTVTVA